MITAILYSKINPHHICQLESAGLAAAQANHRLLAIEVADSQRDYCWPESSQPGKNYTRLTAFPDRDYWDLGYGEIKKRLSKILDDLRPDVVVLPGWGLRVSHVGLGWCFRRSVPRVVVSDSQRIDVHQTLLKSGIKCLLIRQFQAGLAGGAPHVRYLTELGLPLENCFVGCDVVDNQFFLEGAKKHRKNGVAEIRAPVLLSCVRLLPRKNILSVLEVLAARAVDWQWIIAGDGPQRPEIEQRICELGLVDRVRMLGHVSYSDLPSVYAQGDVYLQPSSSEPWGQAVNEAMASGLPVLVSNRCGCREDLVRAGVNGWCFDCADLAAVLERVLGLRDQWPEMGRASQEIIGEWGPELYSRNLWRACEAALRQPLGPSTVRWFLARML